MHTHKPTHTHPPTQAHTPVCCNMYTADAFVAGFFSTSWLFDDGQHQHWSLQACSYPMNCECCPQPLHSDAACMGVSIGYTERPAFLLVTIKAFQCQSYPVDCQASWNQCLAHPYTTPVWAWIWSRKEYWKYSQEKTIPDMSKLFTPKCSEG